MFTVLFAVLPAVGRTDDYLRLAAHLKPMLEAIDGFIDNERFGSTDRDGWVLSLSTWRDEKALVRWRSHGEHHEVQKQGRAGVFSDYHLRVCEVLADTHPPCASGLVEQRWDTTVSGDAKALTITELTPAAEASAAQHPQRLPSLLTLDGSPDGLIGQELFASIAHPGKLLMLASWMSRDAATRCTPRTCAPAAMLRHRCVRSIRDYGIHDRREAPQWFPAPGAGARA